MKVADTESLILGGILNVTLEEVSDAVVYLHRHRDSLVYWLGTRSQSRTETRLKNDELAGRSCVALLPLSLVETNVFSARRCSMRECPAMTVGPARHSLICEQHDEFVRAW